VKTGRLARTRGGPDLAIQPVSGRGCRYEVCQGVLANSESPIGQSECSNPDKGQEYWRERMADYGASCRGHLADIALTDRRYFAPDHRVHHSQLRIEPADVIAQRRRLLADVSNHASINTSDDHTIRADRPVFDLQQISCFSYGTALDSSQSSNHR
jgi:hypothetical protein